MPDIHRIKVKLGDAEFEAEGAKESVQAQYERFLEAVERTSGGAESRANASGKKEKSGHVEIDGDVLGRVLLARDDGGVVLRVLPTTEQKEADALALLLYGYRSILNQEHVLATQLLKAARQSGLGIDRVDRAIASYLPRFVLRGGQRKGTTYTLTSQGVAQAEKVIAGMS